MTSNDRDHLRPIERCVLAMQDDGLSVRDIAQRLKRTPEHVQRMIAWTRLDRTGPASRRFAEAFEQRVLALRARGETYDQIGSRFRRSPRHIRMVEGLAHYRRAMDLLA